VPGEGEGAKGRGLEKFGAYLRSRDLFEAVLADTADLTARDFRLSRLVQQQVASADSICSNIEEGYGRGSKKEFAQFLIIARGSAWETRGRYERLSKWLDASILPTRVALCSQIIGILTKTIRSLRK
jgi:four helix bundle protein